MANIRKESAQIISNRNNLSNASKNFKNLRKNYKKDQKISEIVSNISKKPEALIRYLENEGKNNLMTFRSIHDILKRLKINIGRQVVSLKSRNNSLLTNYDREVIKKGEVISAINIDTTIEDNLKRAIEDYDDKQLSKLSGVLKRIS